MVHNVICAKNTLWLWLSEIFMITQNTQKRCCWHCNILPDYFSPPITLLFIWHENGISECMRKCSMLTGKLLKQCKIFEISLLGSWFFWRNGQLGRLSVRYRPISGVCWTKWESWQHCSLLFDIQSKDKFVCIFDT